MRSCQYIELSQRHFQQHNDFESDIIAHLNRFLSELDGVDEGEGTLLDHTTVLMDHTTVLMGSNMGDASGHRQNNLPVILAGGGHQHENHMPLDKPTPLCNVFLELLNQYNIDADQFGSSTQNMELLKN